MSKRCLFSINFQIYFESSVSFDLILLFKMFKIFDLSKVETIVKYKYYTVHRRSRREAGRENCTPPPPPKFFVENHGNSGYDFMKCWTKNNYLALCIQLESSVIIIINILIYLYSAISPKLNGALPK